MRKKQWKWLPAALFALALAACGDDDKKVISCKADKDCEGKEICHPNIGVCVKPCTSSGDCTSSAKKCEEISAGFEQKICKCSTTQLCNDSKKDGKLLCNDIYGVCLPDDLQVGLDASPGDEIRESCNPANAQPDTCKYGLFCSELVCLSSDDLCEANQCGPTPTSRACNDKFPALDWDPLNPTGPVIYMVESLGYGNRPRHCPSGYRNLQFKVQAYSTGELLAPVDHISFKLYRSPTDLERLVIGDTIYPSEWVKDGNNHATITINLCRPNSSDDSYVAGLAFNNGNTVCVVH